MRISSLPDRLRAVVALVALFILAAGISRAALVPLTIEKMMAIADEVVAVHVDGTESTLKQGKIYTTADFTVVKNFKGKMQGPQTISYAGGKSGKLVMLLPGTATLAPGEDAILFLSKPLERLSKQEQAKYNAASPVVGSYLIVGGTQGKISILGNDEPSKATGTIGGSAKVLRATPGAGKTEAVALTYADVDSALGALAKRQKEKSADKASFEEIAGINGKFAIPARTDDPVLRAFDPLPSMAYMTDDELAAVKAGMRKSIEDRDKAEAAKQQNGGK